MTEDYHRRCLHLVFLLEPIHWRVFIVSVSNLRTSEVKIVINHIEGRMAKDLPERENIAAVQKVIDCKRMPAQVTMQSDNTRTLSQAGEDFIVFIAILHFGT